LKTAGILEAGILYGFLYERLPERLAILVVKVLPIQGSKYLGRLAKKQQLPE
jgi:hypothetical protein